MSYGIKPEWREAWSDVYKIYPWKLLADLSVHLLAGWMRERFEREHEEYQASSVNEAGILSWHCVECGQRSNWDTRHKFIADDWLRVAREELGK